MPRILSPTAAVSLVALILTACGPQDQDDSMVGTGGAVGVESGAGGSTAVGAGGSSSGGALTSGGSASGGTTSSGGTASVASGGAMASSGGADVMGSGGGESEVFALTSAELEEGGEFLDKHTCSMTGFGVDESPPLSWTGAPMGTMSFGLIFIDRTLIDDGKPQLGNHWSIWDIPASASELPANLPAGSPLQEPAMAKQEPASYLGPCPNYMSSAGVKDEYEFILYALPSATTDTSGMGTGAAFVGALMAKFEADNLGKAVLTGHSSASYP